MKTRIVQRTNGDTRKNKTFGLACCTMLLALCSLVEAQQGAKVPHVGYLSGSDLNGAARAVEGFRSGLRDLGYIEGKNILIEYRYGKGNSDTIKSLVAELVQFNVDVLVSSNFNALRAAKQTTKTIPIVMVTTTDPVATGLIDSLARPGGNITGLTRLAYDLSDKRLELLREMAPTISRVGVLFTEDRTRGIEEYENFARSVKIQLQPIVVRGPNPDLTAAFQSAVKGRVNALITGRGPVLNIYRKQIADLAIKNRLPLMSEGDDYADAGALASYSANEAEEFRRAAVFVDKILKGSKPADLPVEQPRKFEFVINLITAKQIGLTIPPNVLARADRVIR
jgi:putative tryptophan/tyrosine transport system substrate-binding protein